MDFLFRFGMRKVVGDCMAPLPVGFRPVISTLLARKKARLLAISLSV